MSESLSRLLPQRRGHFQMESGYHSELWFDLEHLLNDRTRLRPFAVQLADRLARHGCSAVCGPQSGGAKLAEMIAQELAVDYLFSERLEPPTDAPGLFPVKYRLPGSQRFGLKQRAVAIVDDAISAGSAVRGTHADLLACGARPVAIGALFVFGDLAASFAGQNGLPLEALENVTYELWLPQQCPLCRRGVPFEQISDAKPASRLPPG